MKEARAHLPLRYRALNAFAWILTALNRPDTRLDEPSLSHMAIERTDLVDYGDPYYREGLVALLESAKSEAHLTPIGRLTLNNMITNFLVQRLCMVEMLKQAPHIFQSPLRPPLIITGPARSGTTFLHQMLAEDPTQRALPQWLLMRPFPESDIPDDGPDPRREIAAQEYAFRQPLLPDLDAIHYTRADTPEECIVVLGLTFNSLLFPTLFPVYDYMDWYLANLDMDQKYREYRWLLQWFQFQEPQQRLILKAPAHTGNQEALFHNVPEALLVQTHRDPATCISSACSLIYTWHMAAARELDLPRMTSLILTMYEQWFRRNLAFRATHPGMIYDIRFEDLVANPLDTVRQIYAHFGLPWTAEYEDGLTEFIQNHPKNKHGKHRYAPEDFGMTEAEITGRLGFYADHFKN